MKTTEETTPEEEKLIQAAPDLLNALKTCYNLFEAEYEDLSNQGKNARKQAMEAILKATQ